MGFVQHTVGGVARLIQMILGMVLIVGGATAAVLFGYCRVYVPPDKCVVWIAKSGDPLTEYQTVADPGQKGIQRETGGPGRYFFNPIFWEYELRDLVRINAGDPGTWTWFHTTSRLPRRGQQGGNVIGGELPEVGILTRKSGKRPPKNEPVSIHSEYQGIIREVLTPGIYRINPYEYIVEKVPALVVPAGFVGVVTNQIGEQPAMIEVPDVAAAAGIGGGESGAERPAKRIRPLAQAGQRGTLKNVLPPGVYYLNPNVVRVKIIEVGFNEFSQLAGATFKDTIRFPSKSGFEIELGVTVVWGLHPQHAADVINEFGATDEVLAKVIKPQLRSICRNEGSLYEARDFIQGEKREQFQKVLTQALHQVCAQKNIELLLALISTIEVHAPQGGEDTPLEFDIKTSIQDSFLAVERQLTNKKLQATAMVQADLEEAKKKVDIARESVQADTRKKVATTLAEGQRTAAEIEAEGQVQVATIDQQIAMLEAQKVELLGRAKADVEKVKFQAEADGKRILVQALGSGAAYNMYTFARNFEPESIRLIFAGEGTFWTDLKRFEELGATQMLKQATAKPKGEPVRP